MYQLFKNFRYYERELVALTIQVYLTFRATGFFETRYWETFSGVSGLLGQLDRDLFLLGKKRQHMQSDASMAPF